MNVWEWTLIALGGTLFAACFSLLMFRGDLVYAWWIERRISRPTSAMVARERVEWCVRARRHGGAWHFRGFRRTRFRQSDGGPVIETERPVARWRWEQTWRTAA